MIDRSRNVGQHTMSDAEEALAFQLKAVGIEFEREFKFHPERKWRFDFVLKAFPSAIAVEVEGQHNGAHKSYERAEEDLEKFNEAAIGCWFVLRFSTAMVEDGRALGTIEKALGR